MKNQDGQRGHGGPELHERDLEMRVTELEKQVVTLATRRKKTESDRAW